MQLQMFHTHPAVMEGPHWHAQVEVNFIVQGKVHYLMADREVVLTKGDLCLFWGGIPHQMDWRSDDTIYAGAHLPLVHFFRLNLPTGIQRHLMAGHVLILRATDPADSCNFERWNLYARSGDAAKAAHAVNELLLRIERMRFEPYELLPGVAAANTVDEFDQRALPLALRICSFIADNFRDDISIADIAAEFAIHPKYAMSVFRRSTGMTLNEYLNLLRLSYAQAMLMREDANVLHIAMESGFGSLSAFNKSFRRLAGMTPSSFRRAGSTA
ncbi:MAG TPA: helix-turn-helix domain-containing protein [Mesorhizobium sp.]|uniref:helix-turn-helix domain-containing protein n=1 Tax=Mesorhizobium sp. TaxID=1871066 RepID=UPI002DDD91A1|nr:helix-turn-helix domain-containing protein [Mesorhizobium sp.]HEV2502777.1 helix-turn-helix domain-containing protein [Mesorhizobium sp.]